VIHSGSASFQLDADDSVPGVIRSGVKAVSYTFDDPTLPGATWTVVMGSSATVTVSTIGQTTVSYFSVDNAGNVESTKSVTVTVVGESTPPTTTAAGLQNASNIGWITTSQQVTLTATDNPGGSGVKATFYTVDGNQNTYTAAFTVSGNGSHTVTYWSEDVAGNTETARTGYVNIDTLAPITTVSNYVSGTWTNKPVTLQFSADDNAGSGVASTQYSTNGGKKWVTGSSYTVSSSGQTTVSYRSTDKLGNVEVAKQAVVKIDTAAPTIKISTPKNKGKYALGAVVLANWSASDSLSGVASATGTVTSDEAIDTSVAGSFTFTVTAGDNAGNTTTKTVTYSVK